VRSAEILLYDVIGEDWWTGGGFTAKAFAEQLVALDLRAGDELMLRVNSPGGDAGDGLGIYHALKDCKAHKVARVEGLAASAATIVIMGADEVQIADPSVLMIHRAMVGCMGDRAEMLKAAEMLDTYDGAIAAAYSKKSGKSIDECLALMAEETWFDARGFVDAGLADRLVEDEPTEEAPAAKWDPRIIARFRRAPAALKERLDRPPMRLAPAALATEMPAPRAEGQVLSATNKSDIVTIRDKAQAVLDRAEKAPKEEPVDAAALARLTSELERAHARIDTINARLG